MADSAVPVETSDRAIEWLVRLRAGDVTSVEKIVFGDWLREKSVHQSAFVETLQLWEDLSVVKKMPFDDPGPFPTIRERKRGLNPGVTG